MEKHNLIKILSMNIIESTCYLLHDPKNTITEFVKQSHSRRTISLHQGEKCMAQNYTLKVKGTRAWQHSLAMLSLAKSSS